MSKLHTDQASSPAKDRVLIVEDDGLVAEMIRDVLTELGYKIAGIAGDGHAGLEAVAQLRPDVVLMDLRMPGMDGIETTRRIQQVCPTPVVVLTAQDSLDLTAEAAAAGVGAYLVKPPNGRELARAIVVAQARFEENRNLNAFAHTVAHDLKNAMTPIVGVAQLLSEGLEETSVESAREQLDMISKEGQKLGRMVDDLLALSELHDRDIKRVPLDMDKVVGDALNRLALLAEELAAEIILPPSWPTALGYDSWVTEVWFNYLSNALKYGGRPPYVTLGWDRPETAAPALPSHVRFWVRDNGRGLTPEEQAQLFTPYVQLRPTETEGHGLGLSIVRRIVVKLGGHAGVESTVGEGSLFWFTLQAEEKD